MATIITISPKETEKLFETPPSINLNESVETTKSTLVTKYQAVG
jgi:hypothetical protein